VLVGNFLSTSTDSYQNIVKSVFVAFGRTKRFLECTFLSGSTV